MSLARETVSKRKTQPPQQQEKPPGTLRELEALLKELGAHIAAIIPIADAIFVEMTPSQLRDIVLSPLVGVIRPNRTHTIKR